jgi:Leucine-rich repeat (LRR) protein
MVSLGQHTNGPLTSLPDSLGRLSNLQRLVLHNCTDFDCLPANFVSLKRLQVLRIQSWRHDRDCEGLGPYRSRFRTFEIMWGPRLSPLIRLPYSFGSLSSLQQLILTDCYELRRLPDSFGRLSRLQRLDLLNFVSLEALPDSVGNMSSLRELNLNDCSSLTCLPFNFGNMSSLKYLSLNDCSSLASLPFNFGNLRSLLFLNLSGCRRLTSFPDSFIALTSLRQVDVWGCDVSTRFSLTSRIVETLLKLRITSNCIIRTNSQLLLSMLVLDTSLTL